MTCYDLSMTCAACGAATEGGKPYCSEHVEAMPYAARLLRKLAGEPKRTGRRGSRVTVACEVCGETFSAPESAGRRYCGRECSWAARHAAKAAALAAQAAEVAA